MYAGFDYGTSNCAIGVVQSEGSAKEGSAHLLPIERGQAYVPSTLYALERELISESVAHHIPDSLLQEDFITLRRQNLVQAQRVRSEYDIDADEQSLYVGHEAFEHYFATPDDGYFIKSPKSFLGASGLPSNFVFFFEDLVTAMMQQIKRRADALLPEPIRHVVIGRPVNFQGMNTEASNQQALNILSLAAKRAGFSSIEFLFEPIAAGLDFESRLSSEKTVLVVDVGGGTTDCTMMRAGPALKHKLDREADILGHSGERIGGNDLDIELAGQHLMPLFGMRSMKKNGQPMPTQLYWNAVKTNDMSAQIAFNSMQTTQDLQRLLLDISEPALLKRFIQLREEKQNYHVVRSAEQCKIALSAEATHCVDLDYIEQGLSCTVSGDDFASAIRRPLKRILDLMDECIKQADCSPDLIYMTGGSAQSPALRQAIEEKLGAIEIVDANHFGSVATGLTVWAQRLFS